MGVSPTFASIGSFGATGLALPDVWVKEKIDSNCTTNPFIYPVFEHDENNVKKLKWCPGFGDKWRWNINLGGAYVHGVWQNKGIYGKVSKFIKKMSTDDPRHDNFVLLAKDLSSHEMQKAFKNSPYAKANKKKPPSPG